MSGVVGQSKYRDIIRDKEIIPTQSSQNSEPVKVIFSGQNWCNSAGEPSSCLRQHDMRGDMASKSFFIFLVVK